MNNLSESIKAIIAGRQFYKCANSDDTEIYGLENYSCPLWKISDENIRGSFDESGYEIDYPIDYDINGYDINDFQALCRSCFYVKTNVYENEHLLSDVQDDNKLHCHKTNKFITDKQDNQNKINHNTISVYKCEEINFKNVEITDFDLSDKAHPQAFIGYNDCFTNKNDILIQSEKIKLG